MDKEFNIPICSDYPNFHVLQLPHNVVFFPKENEGLSGTNSYVN